MHYSTLCRILCRTCYLEVLIYHGLDRTRNKHSGQEHYYRCFLNVCKFYLNAALHVIGCSGKIQCITGIWTERVMRVNSTFYRSFSDCQEKEQVIISAKEQYVKCYGTFFISAGSANGQILSDLRGARKVKHKRWRWLPCMPSFSPSGKKVLSIRLLYSLLRHRCQSFTQMWQLVTGSS